VIEGEQVSLGYVARDGTATTRVVHPLGLAAKGVIWYLVAETGAGQRTFRVDRVTAVEPTGEKVVRPEGFNLPDAWRQISENVDQMRTPIRARAAAAPGIVRALRYAFGTRLGVGPARADGRIEVELRGHAVHPLGSEIAGYGSALEIFEPPELREHMANLGRELTATYSGEGEGDGEGEGEGGGVPPSPPDR
jgi:predicted DNA-binding transcriptional regulator YafY